MAITPERFAQGLTYAAYKAQMTRNQERFEANERTVELSADDLAFFAQLPTPLHVLVLAEDWCGDVIANLPVLGRLAAETAKLDIRVFLRDQNLDIMDQYLKDGKHRSIPVFVFFDDAFRELGHWIERPARVSELQQAMRLDLFAHDPVFAGVAPDMPIAQMPEDARIRLMQAFTAFREEHRVMADREVVREIRTILELGLGLGRSQQPQTNGVAQPTTPINRTPQPVKVQITYCAECGYQPQTLALTSALMNEFIHELAAIELIPWQDGAFEVTINGELVHSMYRDGGFPDNTAIIAQIRERLQQSA